MFYFSPAHNIHLIIKVVMRILTLYSYKSIKSTFKISNHETHEMKKVFLIALLLISANAFAEWTLIESASSEDGFDVYVNTESKRRDGDKVKMWSMYDYKKVKVDVKSYLASVSHVEYDCKEETLRLLDLFWYTGNMGQGQPVFSNTNIKKDPISIIPETIHESLFNIACDKK